MKETIEHLEFIIAHTERSIRHYDGHEVEGIPFFCLGLLERLHASTKGLKVLIDEVETDTYLEYSVGLIIRTALSDFLTLLRAYDIQGQGIELGKPAEEIEADLKLFCNEVFADGLDNTLRYLQGLQSFGTISNGDMRQRFQNLSERYPTFIEPYDGGEKKPKIKFDGGHSVGSLFKVLSKRPELKPLAMLYDKYLFYSKYEHFGIMSYEVIRQEVGEKLERLRTSVKEMVLHNFIICCLLKDYMKDDFAITQHRSVGEYIETKIFGLATETLKC